MARRDGTSGGTAVGDTFSPAPPSALPGGMFTYVPGRRPATSAAGASSPSSSDPFNMFDDPATAYLTNLIKQQIGDLSHASTVDPATGDVMTLLHGIMTGGTGGASANPLLGDFITQGRQRIAELNQEPFSASDEAALRTKAKDQLTIDRDAQRRTALEDMSRRGIADSSGVLQERYGTIDRAYTSADAKATNDLALYIAGERQRRKSEATGIAGSLAGMGAQEAARTDAAHEASAGRIMQAATTLATMAAQQRGEARANQQQVLNLAAMLAQLPIDRLNMALGIINGTGGGAAGLNSQFTNTLALSNAQANQQRYNQEGSNAFLEGLGALANYYANRTRGGR